MLYMRYIITKDAACKVGKQKNCHAVSSARITVHSGNNKTEVMKMSPKELLYIEDALGHTQFLMNQCRTAATQLKDPALQQQAQQLVNGNQKLFTQFYNLV